MNEVGCVIMASGLGKRFGGNKLMALFDGQPMIARILDATGKVFAHRVVVTRHADVAEFCRCRGVDVILHALPYRSDTVRLGLEAMQQYDHCIFCPADQPLLSADTLAALVHCASEDPDAIWRPVFGDTPGAPILFPAWAYPELWKLPQGKGGGIVVKAYPDRVRLLPVSDGMQLKDVDTPEDLRLLQSYKKTAPDVI